MTDRIGAGLGLASLWVADACIGYAWYLRQLRVLAASTASWNGSWLLARLSHQCCPMLERAPIRTNVNTSLNLATTDGR